MAATAVNLGAVHGFGRWLSMAFQDNVIPGPANTQATATIINTALTRVSQSPASGSLILPSITTAEADPIAVVVNDSPQTALVFCAKGENMNGVANASQSIVAGATGIFIRVREPALANVPDWRSNTIT